MALFRQKFYKELILEYQITIPQLQTADYEPTMESS